MRLHSLFILSFLFIIVSCGSSKSTTTSGEVGVSESLREKNRVTISLLNQIRQLPGIIIRNGVPMFNKTNNSIHTKGSLEPLYVLNDYIVGNSFRDLDQLVDNVNVKKIEALSGYDTSVYGARGANGVIVITTY